MGADMLGGIASSVSVNFAMKSLNTCPLIVVLREKFIQHSLNSIAHLIILPKALIVGNIVVVD